MKTINTSVEKKSDSTEVLRFNYSDDPLDFDEVSLTGESGISDLKKVFCRLLSDAVNNDIHIEDPSSVGNPTGLFLDVCNEYIQDLNRELSEARAEMKSNGIAEANESL